MQKARQRAMAIAMIDRGRHVMSLAGLGLLAQFLTYGPAQSQTRVTPVNPQPIAPTLQTVPPPRTQGNPGAALTSNLLANANYWRAHGEPRVALTDLQRIITYAPANPDILAATAELALELDDYELATKYRLALAQAAPNDPRIPILAAEHRRTPQEIALLADARKLSKSGNNVEAVARYKELFHDGVPPASLQIEYYEALSASTPEGFDQARDAFGKLVDGAPEDDRLQFSYASMLVRQEESRNEGIRLLIGLSKKPDIGRAARELWREVLLWQGASEKAQSQLLAYLQDNPTDPAIQAKLKAFADVLPDESQRALMRGYYAVGDDPVKAEKEFRAALLANPKNPDAMIMVAALLRQRGRIAEAQVLIDRAIMLAPDRKDDLLKTAGGDYPGILPMTADDLLEVSRLTSSGEYDLAEKLLTRLYRGREDASMYIQLGGIQMRAGQFNDAEHSYRQARTVAPKNPDAARAQSQAAARLGRFDEADTLMNEAAALSSKSKDKAGPRKIAIGRAGVLRARAASLDSGAAISLYQNGLATDPKNIYVRFELAKVMLADGQGEQSTAVMQKGVELAKGDSLSVDIANNLTRDLANGSKWQQQVHDIKAAQGASLQRALTPKVPLPGDRP